MTYKNGWKNLVMLRIKKKKNYRHKSPLFKNRCRYWEILVSDNISSGEKNYKYFIGYLYNDHKVL